ncbi:hydrogen gas-evolving membrane-bound hydrogenase subunit E [Methanonatronarchaeum sp. AMET-Sl]|uniref:hydrogen gas-evolving membrane-bound hydrogenase subunit E n=1 Tax=Methanonatronarchaeum sp. AMET-Sl TaxID=3037654 RepID=UPI00244E358A|nr:hydrogen gas-evolving membrane-bound hydrogenase subunit E [Methanonatronarchaeum sp. AMET-Sl]WGI16715.1 hypothetical protein QEN48_04270 [Methanonatronarchaeum sp. AMET-Sl]
MRKKVGAVILILFFSFMLFGAAEARDFGEPEYIDMDEHIIENAQEDTGANNVVTAVLYDYRSFDTLGEATVLFAAIASVMVVLRRMV